MAFIRPASQQDLIQLAELVRYQVENQQTLAGNFQLQPDVDWYGYVAARIGQKDTQLFVAERKGELVGFTLVRIMRQGQMAPVSRVRFAARQLLRSFSQESRLAGFMEDIFVVANARNEGIASELARSAMRWLRNRHVNELQAIIRADNEATLNLSQKMGFEPIKLTLNRKP